MVKVRFQPVDKSAEVRPGTTLLDASRRARVQVRSRCSGGLSCLMCKVKVLEGADALSPPQPNELLKLGALAEEGFRFSCQAKVSGDVTVELPEDPLKAAIRLQLLKQREEENGI
ncbi:2Fe-2S iron-sulfur cluster-binding protein [Gorillibacterium sp. sgz5001074]|uniref:2Fe-2S iron-sulfur cluster-binding protein n=1 Tax=Gorillibacterium sp. sgz5001074 TaxID=3446695 RepID=UPI003F673720